MKHSRKIAHAVADVMLKASYGSLSNDKIRNMFSSAARISGGGGKKDEEILEAWIESIIKHLDSKKDGMISDYILDMIQNIESYLDANFNESDLNEFAIVLENTVVKKLMKDDSVFKIISDAKDSFSANIFKEIHSEECVGEMQKRLRNIFFEGDFDDNFYTSG